MVSILRIGICIVTILSVKCQDLRVRLVLEKGTDNIFFQGFNWESAKHSGPWYKVMLDVASELSQAGITDVWFPPPSDSSSLEGYLPRRLYDLTSSYGNKDKLKQVIQTFHENGIRCISDIVINHRSAEKRDASGYWCIFYGGRDGKLDWGPSSIVKDDETCMDSSGQPDTGVNYPHSPDIDHLNKTVQSELVQWLTWLKTDIGFDGWRFDFAKGYGASFARSYFEKSAAEFAVAEIWDDMSYDSNRQLSYNQDSHRQQIINWIDNTQGTISAFDFTTKGILQQAVKDELWRLVDSNRKPAGVIGWWPEKAVTFVDNHDTGSTQKLWPFPSDKVMQGYAYILTHPGIPCIFWDHFFDWGLKNEILALINIRKRNGINSSSKLHILAAEYNMYVADVDDKVRMKIGSRYDIGYLVPSPEVYDMVAFGNDYCVWQKKFNRVHSQVPYCMCLCVRVCVCV